MKQKLLYFLIPVCLLSILFPLKACNQKTTYADGLERSTPEAEGIPSTAILEFIETIEKKEYELHSIMILRHGKVIAEGWWDPFQPDTRHIMYSASKTILSTAVGFATTENRLSLDDKVISFFPEYQTIYNNNPNIQELTLRNLLTMTAGKEPYRDFRLRSNDWIADFLKAELPEGATSKFNYNSYASYMISAILQRATGQTVMDYLQPRLFAPLGIHDAKSEQSPADITCGGWGMSLKTADMAKIGQLYLQKGNWQRKQLLPKNWIEEATKDQIKGYGYHLWQSKHNSYNAGGAFGQLILVMPEQDMVIAITANAPDTQQEIWQHILPSITSKKLSQNSKAHNELIKKLSSLQIPPLKGNTSSQPNNNFSGTYTIEDNKGIKEIEVKLTDETCMLTIRTPQATYTLPAGNNTWQQIQTDKNSPYYNKPYRNPIGLAPFTVAGSYKWTDTNQIKIKYLFTEDLSNETYQITFEDNHITIQITQESEDPQEDTIILTGKRKTMH